MKILVKSLAILSIAFFLDSCASRKVTRVDPNAQMDISGRWNDTDSKQVAENMTADVLSKPWLTRFSEANEGKRPVVIIGDVLNKSHEHISSETFIKDIERAFVNSGKVRVVESSALRDKIRDELSSQQDNATDATKKELAKELGADFMMFGSINSTVDAYKKEKVVAYKVNLELADLQTTEKVWIGDKEIKKYIKN